VIFSLVHIRSKFSPLRLFAVQISAVQKSAAIFKGWGVKAIPRKDKITELLCQNKEAAKLKKPVSTLYMLSSIEENSKFQDTSRKLEI